MRRLSILVILAVVSGAATAAETPHPGELDSRIRTVDYHGGQVFRLSVHYGYTLLVQFGKNESVEQGTVAMGDPAAWKVGPRGRNLMIKPTAPEAETNMTVITNRRTYSFHLAANDDDGRASMYVVRFDYPRLERAKDREQREAERVASRMENKYRGTNYKYYAKGSEQIMPNRAYDNGQFTYLHYPNSHDMPAVYTRGPDGEEALVNTHVEGDTIVVQTITDDLVLRKNGAVVCIENRGYTGRGRDVDSNTSVPDVERVVK